MHLSAPVSLTRHWTKTNCHLFSKPYIDAILQIAREKHCRVVLFTPPGHHSYRSRLDPAQLRKTYETVEDILAKNEHVVYQNFLADPDFGDADYYDADHLNMAGSVKLSRKMAGLIASMREQTTRP